MYAISYSSANHQSGRQGGKFDGGHVEILMKDFDLLDNLLMENKVELECQSVTTALKSFRLTNALSGRL